MKEPLTIYLWKVGVVNLKLSLGSSGPVIEIDVPTEKTQPVSRVLFDEFQFTDLKEVIAWIDRKVKENGKV